MIEMSWMFLFYFLDKKQGGIYTKTASEALDTYRQGGDCKCHIIQYWSLDKTERHQKQNSNAMGGFD